MAIKKNPEDFYEREKYWQFEKQQKLEQKFKEKKSKEMGHCTFKPNIKKLPIKEGNKSIKEYQGVESFIKRQQAAREERMRKKGLLKKKKKTKRIETESKLFKDLKEMNYD